MRQLVHATDPSKLEKVPEGQAAHFETVVALTVVDALPARHKAQLIEATVDA